MLKLETVAVARLPRGEELTLSRRGDEWLVRVNGQVLMSSRQHGSEEALAEQALSRCTSPRAVLVGGLGLGFTLRAVLSRVGANVQVTVAELVPELVEWNRTHLSGLHENALADPRVHVATGDVLTLLQRSRDAFDAVLLDVDNGPVALSQESNQRLYQPSGLSACQAALKERGVLAVWSAGPSEAFARRLANAGFVAEARSVPVRQGSGGRHVIFLGQRS